MPVLGTPAQSGCVKEEWGEKEICYTGLTEAAVGSGQWGAELEHFQLTGSWAPHHLFSSSPGTGND